MEKKSIPRRDEHSRNGSIYQKFNLDCYIRGVSVTECEMEALWFETLRIEYMINFQTITGLKLKNLNRIWKK